MKKILAFLNAKSECRNWFTVALGVADLALIAHLVGLL